MLSYYSTLKEARFASVAQSVEQLIRNNASDFAPENNPDNP